MSDQRKNRFKAVADKPAPPESEQLTRPVPQTLTNQVGSPPPAEFNQYYLKDLDRVATALLKSGRLLGSITAMLRPDDSSEEDTPDEKQAQRLSLNTEAFPITNVNIFYQRHGVFNPLKDRPDRMIKPRLDFIFSYEVINDDGQPEIRLDMLKCTTFIGSTFRIENIQRTIAMLTAKHEARAQDIADSLALKDAEGVSNLTRLLDFHIANVLRDRMQDFFLVASALKKRNKAFLLNEEVNITPELMERERVRLIPDDLLRIARVLDGAQDGPAYAELSHLRSEPSAEVLQQAAEAWRAANADALDDETTRWNRARAVLAQYCQYNMRYSILSDYYAEVEEKLITAEREDLLQAIYRLPIDSRTLRAMAESHYKRVVK